MSPPAMARSATPTSPGPSSIPFWSSRSTAANPLPAPARPFSSTDGKGTCHERIEDDRRADRGHRAEGFYLSSEERSVGKECGSMCRRGRGRCHKKKQKNSEYIYQ